MLCRWNTLSLFRSVDILDNGLWGEHYFGLSGMVMYSYKDLTMKLGCRTKLSINTAVWRAHWYPKQLILPHNLPIFANCMATSAVTPMKEPHFRELWADRQWVYYRSNYMENSSIFWSFVDGIWIGWTRSIQQGKFNGGNCLYCIWKTILD